MKKVNHQEHCLLKQIQQMFSEHVLCARHSARHWADSSFTAVSSCVPHPCRSLASSLPTKTQNPTPILKSASFDSVVKSVVDTVGNQHIFDEAMKWKGIPALSTGHTE